MPTIKTLDSVQQFATSFHLQGKRIGFASGCFDILHAGHLKLLATAKHSCDILFVGVNSDAYVNMKKGNGDRPIIPESDRVELISALRCVDYAFLFEDGNDWSGWKQLVGLIHPDIIVLGEDHEKQFDSEEKRITLLGEENKNVMITYVSRDIEYHSSSFIANRLKELA